MLISLYLCTIPPAHGFYTPWNAGFPGCICPLYFYTDIYMLDDSVSGFFSNPLGYKYFMYCTIG